MTSFLQYFLSSERKRPHITYITEIEQERSIWTVVPELGFGPLSTLPFGLTLLSGAPYIFFLWCCYLQDYSLFVVNFFFLVSIRPSTGPS